MYNYEVEIYTGDDSARGDDAIVSMMITGERGDTGTRKLLKSTQEEGTMFDENRVSLYNNAKSTLCCCFFILF